MTTRCVHGTTPRSACKHCGRWDEYQGRREAEVTNLSPEQIQFIVEWWRSGNEPRPALYLNDQGSMWDDLYEAGVLDVDSDILNPAGITLAKMAIALEQAKRLEEFSDVHHAVTMDDFCEAHRAFIASYRELLG